jgi:hypothetical protein
MSVHFPTCWCKIKLERKVEWDKYVSFIRKCGYRLVKMLLKELNFYTIICRKLKKTILLLCFV